MASDGPHPFLSASKAIVMVVVPFSLGLLWFACILWFRSTRSGSRPTSLSTDTELIRPALPCPRLHDVQLLATPGLEWKAIQVNCDNSKVSLSAIDLPSLFPLVSPVVASQRNRTTQLEKTRVQREDAISWTLQ